MTGTRKTVLDLIKAAGESGITRADLAREAGRSYSAVLRLAVKLEAEGLVLAKREQRGWPSRLEVIYYDPKALKAAAERKRQCDVLARAFLRGDMTLAEVAAVRKAQTQTLKGAPGVS